MRPNHEGWVTGTARPVHLGRSSHVWSIEVMNEAGKMTFISRMTMAIVPVDKHGRWFRIGSSAPCAATR